MTAVPIAILDESARMRDMLRGLLSGLPQVELTCVTHRVDTLIERARRSAAVVILASTRFPGAADGSLIDQLRSAVPVSVILVCRDESEERALGMVSRAHGVCGLLREPLSEADRGHLVSALLALLPKARITRSSPPGFKASDSVAPALPTVGRTYRTDLIAIGASTGGVEATTQILRQFPSDAPPTLLVQHIREGFASSYARGLDAASDCEVRVATDGDVPEPGLVLIAPGDKHLSLVRKRGRWSVKTDSGPPVNQHRPSVDRLFTSVAEFGGRRATGVLLTGMGHDGAAGLLEMRRAGMATIAQDAATSAVYGMPKAAVEMGAVTRTMPLQEIIEGIFGQGIEK